MLAKALFFLLNILHGSYLTAFCLSKKGRFLCALILGIAGSLGYAPYDLWIVTLGALTLLLVLLAGLKSKGAVFFTVLTFFTALFATSLSWLNFVMEGFGQMNAAMSWFCTVLLSMYLALHYAFFSIPAFSFSRGKKAAFICFCMPAAIAAADFSSGVLFTGFPWMYLGNTALSGPFSAFLPLSGARGTGILMSLCAGCVAMAALRRYLFLPFAGVIVFAGLMLQSVQYTKDGVSISTACVQGNIPQSIRLSQAGIQSSVAVYWDLSRELLGKFDMVVWPEAALPFYMNDAMELLGDLNAAAASKKSALVTGVLRRDGEEKRNSIVVLGDTQDRAVDEDQGVGRIQYYDKRYLVPFGEFVPFAEVLRPLGRIFQIPMSDFKAPQNAQLALSIKGIKFIPAICYEAIFPEAPLAFDDDEAGAILMISNDAWFGTTRGPYEHFNIARIRAMELQKPMLRVTNNGITALIGPDGKIVKALPRDERAVLETKLVARSGRTPYAEAGAYVAFVLMLLLVVAGIFISRRHVDENKEKFKELVRP